MKWQIVLGNLRINLKEVDGKGQLSRKDLLEAKGMQKDGNANGSQVQQVQAVNELGLLGGWSSQVDQKVDEESQKVLGPQVKELDHFGSNGVKGHVLGGSAIASGSSGTELGHGEPGTDQNVGKEHKHGLHNLTRNMGLDFGTEFVIVVHRSKDTHHGKENILMHKTTRSDCLVRVVARVRQFWKDLEGKECRIPLDDTCTKKINSQ